MTTWVFDGTVLPVDEEVRIAFGDGEEQLLPGRFGLPGLVDSHCHLTVGSDAQGPLLFGEDFARTRLDALAQAGVSAVRDVGGDRSVTLKLAIAPEDGRPVVQAAGRFLAPEGRYFPRMHEPVPPEELLAAVAAELDDNATWLKLVGDFPAVGPDGPIRGSAIEASYEVELVEAMVEAAHARGARVAAHTNSAVVGDLVRAGVDSIEHGTVITEEDLQALGARGGAWTPTLGASVLGRPGEPQDVVDRRRARSEYLASMLPLAIQYGVRVLAGSDVVGSVAGEVDLLVKHGLTADQALAAATTSAQDYLGLAGTGNLVTYEADPREHPEVLATPSAVVLRGLRIR
ncbi:amidohydrolase family protein [Kribbella sancticallisti]|uniref:Amidohydrolase family protein n=1 Tax=Kribbella sancticallisti TaxID=460087 RepID=A0ABN2CWA5_9ACTN